MRTLVLLFFLIAAASPPVRAAEVPQRVRAVVDRLPKSDQDFLSGATYAGKYPQSSLASFSTHVGRLRADFHLPDELVKQFDPATNAPLLIELEGSPHVWSVHRRKASTLDQGLSLVGLTCWAMNDNGPFQRFAVASDGITVTVSAHELVGHPMWLSHVQLTQSERAFHVGLRLASDKYQLRRIELNEFAQLPLRAPDLYEKHVVPILRRLGPGRAAADVYRVFDKIPADPRVVREIRPLIARLDADDSRDRDAAARDLRRMGRPAMLAAMRLDPSLLTPEQNSRLASLRLDDGWARLLDVGSAARDEAFLESCLEDEDPSVRTAASNTLAALRAAKL
jgi:hypothetical protein